MKTALITTTINVPHVLKLYRKLGPGVRFFVAIDEKTPEDAGNFLAYDLPNTQISYLQHEWKCSPLLGYNTDSRRNLALLEALRWGADIIVSVDDDMIPTSPDFFQRIEDTLTLPWSGLQLGENGYWVDAGMYTIPQVPQRGLPLDFGTIHTFSCADEVRVGATQGIILGSADTNGAFAATNSSIVHSATDILREGFVVNPKAHSVFNSQITAFRRELAPCFAQFYKWQGRNTDIFASLVMRRVMREFGLHTFFGPPFGFHARSQRPALNDIKSEIWGQEHIIDFVQWLDGYVYMSDDKTPLDATRRIYSGMSEHILPKENIECALAFLEDAESVL